MVYNSLAYMFMNNTIRTLEKLSDNWVNSWQHRLWILYNSMNVHMYVVFLYAYLCVCGYEIIWVSKRWFDGVIDGVIGRGLYIIILFVAKGECSNSIFLTRSWRKESSRMVLFYSWRKGSAQIVFFLPIVVEEECSNGIILSALGERRVLEWKSVKVNYL